MADKIDANLAKQVAKTQDILSPFVKKSLLVEKHLARPPFRQIHDIIMNINDSTGFFKGLFTAEELDSNNIKTKEAKVAFLQKIIDVLGIATGQTMSLRPSKVLSGLEVEKTNEFLQSLGKALKDGVKSSDAVKTVTGKGKAGAGSTDTAKQAAKPKTDASKKPAEVKSRSKDPSPAPAKKPGPAPPAAKASEKTAATTKKEITRDGGKQGGLTGTKPAAAAKTAPSQKAKGSTERLNAKPQAQPMKVMPPAPAKDQSKGNLSKAGKSQPAAAPASGPNSRRNSLTNAAQSDSKANISRSASFTIQKGDDSGAADGKSDSTANLADTPEFGSRRNSEVDADNSDHGAEVDGGFNFNVDIDPSKDSAPEPSSLVHANGDAAANASNLASGDTFDLATSMAGAGDNTNQTETVVDQSRGGISRGRQPTSTTRDAAVPVTATPAAAAADRSSAMPRGRNPSGTGARAMNGTAEESPADGFFTRPASARPGAPRPKTASTNYREDTTAFRPPTSKVSNVLVDTAEDNADEDDEADRFVVQEKASDPSTALSYGVGKSPFGGIAEDDGVNIEELAPEQRGFLVNQILETKKEFEDTMLGKLAETELTETERSKLHQNWEAEIGKLKNLLQTIARASNPLGKLMDYVQEDVDTMLTELNQYREESRRLDELYEEEQKKMKEELAPIQRQLDEMDDEVKDAEDAVIGTKLEVLRQEERINKILQGLESVPKGGYGTLDPSKLPKSIKVFGVDVDMNSTGSPFRNDAVPDFSQFTASSAGTGVPSYLQVPEANLNSLVLEEDYS